MSEPLAEAFTSDVTIIATAVATHLDDVEPVTATDEDGE